MKIVFSQLLEDMENLKADGNSLAERLNQKNLKKLLLLEKSKKNLIQK